MYSPNKREAVTARSLMKEVTEQFCNSVRLDQMDQRVRRAAAEDAPLNVVKLIATRMIGVPRILICFNPVEAVVAPSANPIDVIFIPATVAIVPAPAELALSPERAPAGGVEEGGNRTEACGQQWPGLRQTAAERQRGTPGQGRGGGEGAALLCTDTVY